MYSCGEVGQSRADEVLLRVPLKLQEQNSDLKVDSQIRAGEIVGVLKDVNKTCFEYKRESVRRTVCRVGPRCHECRNVTHLISHVRLLPRCSFPTKIMAWLSPTVSQRRTGVDWLASSTVSWRNISPMVREEVSEVKYNIILSLGPRKFTQYALALAPSVKELRSQSTIQGVFVHRLIFAVRYARFHELIQQQEYQDAASDLVAIFIENVAPTSWWAVVLCDSVQLLQYCKSALFFSLSVRCPSNTPLAPALLFTSSGASLLLQKLEEIFVRASQGAADDYLPVLVRVLRVRGDKEALERLKLVRLALAHYFGRSLVLGVGGTWFYFHRYLYDTCAIFVGSTPSFLFPNYVCLSLDEAFLHFCSIFSLFPSSRHGS